MGRIKSKISKYNQRLIWIKHAAKQGGVSLLKARGEMRAVRDEYGISYEKFAKSGLILCRDEEERQKAIDDILRSQNVYLRRTMGATGWDEAKAKAEMDRVRKKFGISYFDYQFNQLYSMSDEEIAQWKSERKAKREAIVQYAMEESGWSRSRVLSHMSHCSADYSILQSSYKGNRCWELTDEQLGKMANDGDSAALSARYNGNTKMLVDKGLFDECYSEFTCRKHWTNNEGASYDSFLEFVEGTKALFYKPLNLSCGIGAGSVDTPADEKGKKDLYEWFMENDPLVVEEKIEQHHDMSAMYSESVNTVRITNLQTEDGVCHHILSFVRFGTAPGVDNFKNGGIAAAVDIESGEVITDAKDNEGRVYKTHPVTGKQIKGFRIPMWKEALELVDNALAKYPEINYVGWDVAIREDRPVIVEGNSKAQSSTYQTLFDARTEGKKYTYEQFL